MGDFKFDVLTLTDLALDLLSYIHEICNRCTGLKADFITEICSHCDMFQ